MNLNDLLAIPRRIVPDKPALQYVNGAESATISYKQLYTAVDRLAASLVGWGLQPGDRAAFFLSNRPEYVIAFLAVLRVGAIATPLNLRYRRAEIGHILGDSTPRLLVTEQSQLDILDSAGTGGLTIEEMLLAEDIDRWQVGTSSDESLPLVTSDNTASIIYTSGTTGPSKGAMLSHSNLLATVAALKAAWAWERDDRLLLSLPLFHVHGLIVGLLTGLASGATILLRRGYDREETVRELLGGEPTLFFAVPTIYVWLVDALKECRQVDLSHMRLFCSGSAPLSPETFGAFRDITGHTILERYGMTETGMNLSNPYAGIRRPGTVGTPLPGVEIRIVDSSGDRVGPGEEGEILVRGSNVFSGYWNAPEKTAASFLMDEAGRSWFRTGDLASQDPATGYVTLLGRRHELIISGGLNIYPREIEEILQAFPGVIEAAVVGRPHREWGQVPVAYIVCEDGVQDGALRDYCRQQLASYKVPAEFTRIAELPRNAMGKLQKQLLS